MKNITYLLSLMLLSFCAEVFADEPVDTQWAPYENTPVRQGPRRLLHEDGVFKMWSSRRAKESIGYAENIDDIACTEPRVVLAPCDSGLEERINRGSVVLAVLFY